MTFDVAGLQVLEGKYVCNESSCRLDLSLQGAKSTGLYKCEVSGDAPHFKLADKADNMTVAGELSIIVWSSISVNNALF